MVIKKYFLNINFYRLLIGFFFLIITFLDLYKVIYIHRPIYIAQNIDVSSCDILRGALFEQAIEILIYLSLVLLYIWKFGKNKFFTWYLRIIDIFFLLCICYMIYLCMRP